jgi:hypothetical protein
MASHRFRLHVNGYLLPEPPAPTITPGHFVACPAAFIQGLSAQQLLWQQMVYQLAFEQAQAALRPSLLERDLLAAWN